MAASELTARYGSIYYYHRNEMSGLYYLKEIDNHFKNNVVWLNPEIIRFDWQAWTRRVISGIFPMFNLTVEGIEEAMDYLRTRGKRMYTTVDKMKDYRY